MIVSPEKWVFNPDYAKQRTMKYCHIFLALLLIGGLSSRTASAKEKKHLGVQFAENPPMHVISKTHPPPAIEDTFEIREGFVLVKRQEKKGK
jgi:hypothetical protein